MCEVIDIERRPKVFISSFNYGIVSMENWGHYELLVNVVGDVHYYYSYNTQNIHVLNIKTILYIIYKIILQYFICTNIRSRFLVIIKPPLNAITTLYMITNALQDQNNIEGSYI